MAEPTTATLTDARRFQRVLEILDEYDRDGTKIIPIL